MPRADASREMASWEALVALFCTPLLAERKGKGLISGLKTAE